jgi:hypothetical protein
LARDRERRKEERSPASFFACKAAIEDRQACYTFLLKIDRVDAAMMLVRPNYITSDCLSGVSDREKERERERSAPSWARTAQLAM